MRLFSRIISARTVERGKTGELTSSRRVCPTSPCLRQRRRLVVFSSESGWTLQSPRLRVSASSSLASTGRLPMHHSDGSKCAGLITCAQFHYDAGVAAEMAHAEIERLLGLNREMGAAVK